MKTIAIAALIGSISASKLNACLESGINGAGLSCVPNQYLFATGMNGDEDLGEDIIMKGEPFHYNQKKTQHLAQGDDAAAEDAAEEKKDKASEDKMAEADAKAKKAEANAKESKIGPSEKVSVLETVIAKEHTTFYDKKQPKMMDLVQLNAKDGELPAGYDVISPGAEKVSILDQGQVTYSNTGGVTGGLFSFPHPYRTAFYVQIDDDMGLWRF